MGNPDIALGIFIGAFSACIFAIPYFKFKLKRAMKKYTDEVNIHYKAMLKEYQNECGVPPEEIAKKLRIKMK